MDNKTKYFCPLCKKDLTKKTKKMEVSIGYFRACLNCNEDFYKFELKELKINKNIYENIQNAWAT